jgi:hypothetical protein
MLQRWRKHKYFRDIYSLSGSFWGQTAQISCLTGRASQNAFKTTTPSCLSYDGGGHFYHSTCQGCKKSAKIQLLVDNTFGDKTLLTIQTNCIIKAVKDQKMAKITKRTANLGCHCRCSVKSLAARPSLKLLSRRLWLRLSLFLSRKSPYCHPRLVFGEE